MPRWASQESKVNREKKKNITIEFDTWERLKSFGKMGDTFDDVLNRLMETSAEHSDIPRLQQSQPQPQQDKNIENVNVSPGVVSSRVAGSEKPLQQQKENLYKFSTAFSLNLPGLKFPATKGEIIKLAKDINTRPLVNALNRIPDKEYKHASELEGPLTSTYHDMFAINPVKKITITTEYSEFVQNIKNEQLEHEEVYKLKDEKWTLKDRERREDALWKFIRKIADEHKIHGSHAIKLIMKRKDLLKELTDEMGTDDEALVYYTLKSEADHADAMEQFHASRKEKDKQQKEKEEATSSAR